MSVFSNSSLVCLHEARSPAMRAPESLSSDFHIRERTHTEKFPPNMQREGNHTWNKWLQVNFSKTIQHFFQIVIFVFKLLKLYLGLRALQGINIQILQFCLSPKIKRMDSSKGYLGSNFSLTSYQVYDIGKLTASVTSCIK